MKVEILKIDVPNASGRIYSRETVEKAIENITPKYGVSYVDSGGTTSINLDKVSHQASNFVIEDNSLYCDIKVLETPLGNILKGLIDNEVKIKYYSCGVGEIHSGKEVVDYSITSVNWQPED